MNPEISIILPIYGVEKYLHQCVDSILAQTFTNIEIILIDDGSKDKCPEIVDAYALKDPRVVAIHQPNSGYGVAVNHGLELARGNYIGIIDSDDWIEPNMYETLYQKAKETGVDIVKCNFINELPRRRFKNPWATEFNIPTEPFDPNKFPIFLYFHPSIWGCLYRADFIKKHHIRLPEIPGTNWSDNLFQVQTFCYSQKVLYLDEALYHYRRQNDDDAYDLKIWHIPLDRTHEIHAWMREENITNPDVWGCLYKRELAYICLICRMAPLKKIRQIAAEIRRCVKEMDPKIVENCSFINDKERQKVKEFQNHPVLALLKYSNKFTPKVIRKFLICIHIKKNAFLFQLLGIQVVKGYFPQHRALWKIRIKEKK